MSFLDFHFSALSTRPLCPPLEHGCSLRYTTSMKKQPWEISLGLLALQQLGLHESSGNDKLEELQLRFDPYLHRKRSQHVRH